MRSAAFIATTLAASLWSASCSSPTSPSPETFTLAPGESATYRQLAVTFEQVIVDSRCPEEALVICIQLGDAYLTLRAETPLSGPRQYDVQVLDEARRRFVHAGYEVEVAGLEPKPFVSGPIDPSDYRLSLKIGR